MKLLVRLTERCLSRQMERWTVRYVDKQLDRMTWQVDWRTSGGGEKTVLLAKKLNSHQCPRLSIIKQHLWSTERESDCIRGLRWICFGLFFSLSLAIHPLLILLHFRGFVVALICNYGKSSHFSKLREQSFVFLFACLCNVFSYHDVTVLIKFVAILSQTV